MKCRFRGLYIYPGLPNATSVQQETDHNYGPFKGVVRDNLKKMSSAFYADGLSIGSSSMAELSRWAHQPPSLAEMHLQRRSMWNQI